MTVHEDEPTISTRLLFVDGVLTDSPEPPLNPIQTLHPYIPKHQQHVGLFFQINRPDPLPSELHPCLYIPILPMRHFILKLSVELVQFLREAFLPVPLHHRKAAGEFVYQPLADLDGEVLRVFVMAAILGRWDGGCLGWRIQVPHECFLDVGGVGG